MKFLSNRLCGRLVPLLVIGATASPALAQDRPSGLPTMSAPTREECIAASEESQALRKDSKLLDARKQAMICIAASCPQMVRDDCTQRILELDNVTPTLVFDAEGEDGADLADVVVTVDGKVLVEKLDGTPLLVDPGPHEFTFQAAGKPSVAKRLVVKEGEKGRRETILLGAPRSAKRPPRLVVAARAGDRILVDGQDVGFEQWSGAVTPGAHEVRVTHPGKLPYQAAIDVAPEGDRELKIALENEPTRVPTWLWLVGGAAVVAGGVVGGYFAFRGSDEPAQRPVGKWATVTLSFGGGALR
jgi:hypothetical protein